MTSDSCSSPSSASNFFWRNQRHWSGFAAALDVKGRDGVGPGWCVRVDFGRGRTPPTVLSLSGAVELSGASDEGPAVKYLRPDTPTGTISLTLRGDQASPRLQCVAQPAAPPPPPLPCLLGATWEPSETVKEGKRYVGVVNVASW